jgi:hypothetical protein
MPRRRKQPPPPPRTIVINLTGGLVESVFTDFPGVEGALVIVTELAKYGEEGREEVQVAANEDDDRIIYSLDEVLLSADLHAEIEAARKYEAQP